MYVIIWLLKDTNMKPKDLSKISIEITLSMLNTKWKPLIIKELLTGTKRFLELQTAIGKITKKVLIKNLRDMEEKELLERKSYKEIPPRVEYTLTDLGYSLATVLDSMAEWGGAYYEFQKIVAKRNKKNKLNNV